MAAQTGVNSFFINYVTEASSTITNQQASFICHPFPAICIRTSTERPEAIDKGDFIIAGIDEKSLLQAVDTAVELCRDGQHGIPVPDYVDENVSTKVVQSLFQHRCQRTGHLIRYPPHPLARPP